MWEDKDPAIDAVFNTNILNNFGRLVLLSGLKANKAIRWPGSHSLCCKARSCENVTVEKENSHAPESSAALSDCPPTVDPVPLLFFFPQPAALTLFPGDRK